MFAIASAFESVLAAIGVSAAYFRKREIKQTLAFSAVQAKAFLKEGWPIIAQGIAIMAYMRIDQIMLRAFTDTHQVGVYSVAVQLIEIWYFFPMALTASLYPAIIRSKRLGSEAYYARLQQLYDVMIWTALVTSIVVTFIAEDFIGFLFGASYAESGAVLTIQVWMGCAVFFGVSRQKWLTVENYLQDGLWVEITGLFANIALNFLLIPKFGAVGASIASLITAIGANLVVAVFSKPIRISMQMYGKSLMLPVRYLRSLCAE
jgi:PST family polysaccharide transporter